MYHAPPRRPPLGAHRLRQRRGGAVGGRDLFAGRDAEVVEVTNLSTGYCPEPSSWPAVARALESAGIAHPGQFTAEMTFRRCTACGERNRVKDELFVCAICDADLPAAWNFARGRSQLSNSGQR